MGGLFTYTLAGCGFVLVGALESLVSCYQTLINLTPSPPQPSTNRIKTTPSSSSSSSSSSSITFIAVSVISFFFIINALISLIDAHNAKDPVGSTLQLQVIAISSLFFLYSVLGLLTHFANTLSSLSSLLNLLCLFGFAEEFLLFYLQRKDPSGIENRYFDLLLVPITVCIFSTVFELKTQKSSIARLGRGIGLILQGMWFIQMGFSFYSDLIAHGCSLHEKSRGNFTLKCKGHSEYHRARALATLQFNCHLALIVVVIVGLYSIMSKTNGVRGEFMQYKPIGAEMQHLDSVATFTLDSDDDNEDGIKEECNLANQKALVMVPELGINGHGSY